MKTSPRRTAVYLFSGVILLFLLTVCSIGMWAATSEQAQPKPQAEESIAGASVAVSETVPGQEVELLSVTDGDTIKVRIDNKELSVRLLGIDTPELHDPRKPVECYAQEASAYLQGLLTGKKIYVTDDTSQGDKDKYDRLLRYVWLPEGTLVNKTMIKEGYAFEYTYNTAYQYQAEFKQAQQDAQNEQKGLWSSQTCSGQRTTVSSVTPTTETQVTTKPSPTPKVMGTTATPRPTSKPAACLYSCTSPDRDCKDFSSHAQAQKFFSCCGFTATNDPMKLDGVGVDDGIACESLP